MDTEDITSDDVIFFMDMVDSAKSPNFKPKFNRVKPYYKILDNPNSDEFLRFIKIYNKTKHILKERERQISDNIYGVHKTRATFKEACKPYNITPERRVRQILYKAETNLVRSLLNSVKSLDS